MDTYLHGYKQIGILLEEYKIVQTLENNPIVKIIMERDGFTQSEAIALFLETQKLIEADPMDSETIMLEQLGLEMDYIFDIL